jgi:hypothetical protein
VACGGLKPLTVSDTDMFERDKRFFSAVLDEHERLLKRHRRLFSQRHSMSFFPHVPRPHDVKDLDWR